MRRIAVVLAVVLTVLGCSGPTEASSDLSAEAGTWVLRTINGNPLPFRILNTGANWADVTADSLFLDVKGSYKDRSYYDRMLDGVVDHPVTSADGTWSLRGGTATFVGASGNFSATFTGTQLIVAGQGLTSIYTK
ncbi:MAG: hypothetical protein V4550_13830 [Gemmatimonadota bacterium]